MEDSIEDVMVQTIISGDVQHVNTLISRGANPNKITKSGKTSLGAAAFKGDIRMIKALIEASHEMCHQRKCFNPKRRLTKSQKRKIRPENGVKIKSNKNMKQSCSKSSDAVEVVKNAENQGYFMFFHNEGCSSDDSKNSVQSPVSSASQTPSPQGELEWDEDIGVFAATTSEDETWSSIYKWYAAILERTGAALALSAIATNGINQQDSFMRTALHYAAEQGHVTVVKLLIDAGCKLDLPTSDGIIPLHSAVMNNHCDVVKILLACGSQVNYKTHEKLTPLHFATSRGYLEVVKILVAGNALLEARDTSDRTALYLASARGHVEVVKYLIGAGANVNCEEIHGYTPLCEAVWGGQANVVEVLLTAGARVTHSHRLLHSAVMQREEEIISLLGNETGGLNIPNEHGDPPLLLACRIALPRIADLLLKKGAPVNSRNKLTGSSALHVAVESITLTHIFEELLVYLLEHNIDMNCTALTGDTALNRALLMKRDRAARLLIQYGADVNACDLRICGLDNLTIAARRDTPDLALMLIQAGHVIPNPELQSHKPGTTAYYLNETYKSPLRLDDLCRIKIRKICANVILYKNILALPLPKLLLRFLMMEGR